MGPLEFFMGISALSALLFINEHYISKELKRNLLSERITRSVLETITEDLLEKMDELYFEINELKRQQKEVKRESPIRSVGNEDRRLDL